MEATDGGEVYSPNVGGLHGVRLPRPKNLFFVQAYAIRLTPSGAHAKAKELFLTKKRSPPDVPVRTANSKFN